MSKQNVNRKYWIDPKVRELGVKFLVAEVYDLHVRRKDPQVEDFVSGTIKELTRAEFENSQIIESYLQLFRQIGVTDQVASPILLHRMIAENGRLPTINTVVDVYNALSAKFMIVASAHDLQKITGDVGLKLTVGDEEFLPLGSKTIQVLPPGEWAGVDNAHVLCRLNCKQSELSKVDLSTTQVLVYVQGNSKTSIEYMSQSIEEICSAIIRFNGGRSEILSERL